jgi:chromosomal replication initiation ATPase DnaA
MITVASIQQAVAREYGIPVEWMREPAPRGPRRVNTWNVAHPRQAAIALSVMLTNHSRTRIGHFFGGRDRATVYHAVAAVARRRNRDRRLHHALIDVAARLTREEAIRHG